MQVQYDKYFDERGQITVFLSLLFLVLMMSFLFIVEGVISYSASSLGEDAVKGAGESIMANYDRELFKNYHLFFLDKTVSREHAVILEDIYEGDGQGYILRDMGSTNGTWLNGKKIKRGNQEQLEDGAVIRFAKKEYEFLIQDI